MLRKPEPVVALSDPCPCGSGRKYRRCCWASERREYSTALRAIGEVHDPAFEFSEERFPEILQQTQEEFFLPAADALGEDEVEKVVARTQQMIIPNIIDAFLADARCPDGRPPITAFLDDSASASLHPAAREYLAAWAAAPVSLFEVEKLTRGEGMVLNDLLRRRRLEVVEKSATESLERWDVLFARVAEMDGINLLTGTLYPISRSDLDAALEQIRRFKELPGSRSLTWTRFLKRDWPLVPELWFHLNVAASTPPQLTNMDGDPLLQVALEFDVRDADRLRPLLGGIPGVHPADPDFWIWEEERTGNPLPSITMAHIELEGDTLRVNVNSIERESRVVELLRRHAGDCLGPVTRQESEFDLEAMRESERPYDARREPSIPPEIERQVVHQHLEEHYNRWPDEEIPALDGRTPREAARDRELRPRLVSLLKEMELQQARASRAMASFDLSFLWAKLGLKRP